MEHLKIKLKIKLLIMAAFLIIIILGLGSCMFLISGVSVSSSILPMMEEELMQEYKEISIVANIDLAEMVSYDAVRYENDFSLANPSDTAFEFLIVNYEKLEKRTRCIEKDEEGKCIETEEYWETIEEKTFYNKQSIFNFLNDLGYSTSDWTIKEVMATLKSLNEEEEYIINFMYRDIEDMMINFTEKEIEWANILITEGIIYQMYGEIFDLPDYIAIVGDAFFTWPTPDLRVITSQYGYRIHPTEKETIFHYGIDISGENAMGKPIISIADGEVIQVNHTPSNTAGNNVRIRHIDADGNEWQSRYCHMSQITAFVGQSVQKGQVIGAVGNTGRSTGPHLHFELKYNGRLVDPYLYINK